MVKRNYEVTYYQQGKAQMQTVILAKSKIEALHNFIVDMDRSGANFQDQQTFNFTVKTTK